MELLLNIALVNELSGYLQIFPGMQWAEFETMSVSRQSLKYFYAWPLRSGILRIFGAISLVILIYISVSSTSLRAKLSGKLNEKQAPERTLPTQQSLSLDAKTTRYSTLYLNKNQTDVPQITKGPFYLTTVFQSRLGNHMFIYASLLGIAKAQNRIPFIHSGTLLDNVFKISHVNNNISTDGFRLLKHPTFGVLDRSLWNLSQENITLHGPREVFRYFENIQDEIRREFTFCEPLQKQINETLGKVRAEFKGHVIVGVHVRRGDFLTADNKKIGFGVPNMSYFVKAFNKIKSLLSGKNVTFVVASDDLEWCRGHLNFTDVRILEPGSAQLHFGVLANCDHVILTSGTYGWWAAWLANGISIYYDGYFVKGSQLWKEVTLADYYPSGWIAVGD